jgi:hypothetical protein
MPRRPPRCPDCSSPNSRPISDGDPEEQLGRRAERGEVVLGDRVIRDKDPAWSCSACGRRFGAREKPYKAIQSRSPEEWLELIGTMLPAPVRANEDGELVAGDPAVVIVRVSTDVIRIMTAGVEWQGAHSPNLKGLPFAKVPLRASAARVAELIGLAWGKRISEYRWCPQCRRRVEPEHMLEAVCHGCATRVLGVVF